MASVALRKLSLMFISWYSQSSISVWRVMGGSILQVCIARETIQDISSCLSLISSSWLQRGMPVLTSVACRQLRVQATRDLIFRMVEILCMTLSGLYLSPSVTRSFLLQIYSGELSNLIAILAFLAVFQVSLIVIF
ncbi:hypothetical protein FGO68_gene14740 [Halteria grandinella]|uniref:Uncharacterized protein n=1 Tax=Halteria grandinella TaxID=5974 RepID=A0A8J8T0C5_HALGN|nr:hypothetical protein FGO68_gene14740 [Halteria grandinella]